jgi:hypothetical protein
VLDIDSNPWREKRIWEALRSSLGACASTGFIHLDIGDTEGSRGVGVDDRGWFVALFPSQVGMDGFADTNLAFSPEQLLRAKGSAEDVSCSTLRCSFPDITNDEMMAVAFVFSALLRLSTSTNDPAAVGRRIWALRQLFERRMVAAVSFEVEIGLIGELLTLISSTDPDEAIRYWHSGPNDRYDFSRHNARIEVKTTSALERAHWFSGSQLLHDGLTIVIFSVVLEIVEVGQTLAGLYEALSGRLRHQESIVRLTEICFSVLGAPPLVVSSLSFDEKIALGSIRALAASEIPAPRLCDGVLEVRWKALIDETLGESHPDVVEVLTL